MKIAFITENSFLGRPPRTDNNLRTDLAWIIGLEADHYPFYYQTSNKYDVVICILPKKNIEKIFDNDLIGYLRSLADKVLFMQEGPNYFWQDYKLDVQVKYFNFLQDVDGILCHNDFDLTYYKGLTGKPVEKLQSLMIEDNLNIDSIERTGVMIGGTMCSWYSGMDSLVVATRANEPIYAPSMGRKQPEEDAWGAVNYLPYMTWKSWMHELNKRRYGVHLMRTIAAGTFALNCAYLGIPCIGYEELDTQRILHPLTTIKLGDIEGGIKIMKMLLGDSDFYNRCVEETKEAYDKFYSEGKFKELMKERLSKF